MIQKEQKKGVLMHIDLVKDCIEPLTQPQRGALLETIVAGYYPKIFTESDDEMVRAMAHIIRGNIRNNDERYEKRKQKQAETWAKYNERKKAAQSAQPLQSTQSLQSSQSLQSLQATTTTTSYTSSTTNTSSDTYTDTNTDTNSDNNQVINKVNNKNNSLSENKYTLDEVVEILERERIFFKKNWLKQFFQLNSITYKWKFDPVSAAQAYIRIHPASVKGEKENESAPPSSAAPPEGAAGAAYSEMQAAAYRAACELWDAIYKEIRPKIRDEDSKFLLTNIRPDIAWRQGYTVKSLRFILKNGDSMLTFAELMRRVDGIFAAQRETFTKYGVKIYYRPEVEEGTEKDVNG